jgi:formylglycine-generating enzyme required for sulfatase activity
MIAPGAFRAVRTLAAVVVLSAGCDSGSNRGTEGSEAGPQDATSPSSSGGSGGGSGSGSGAGESSSGGGLPGSSGGSGGDSGSDGGGSDGGADSGPPMQSCAPGGPGLSNCGNAVESCCTTLEVPGGTFDRTYDPLDTNGNVTLAADGGPTGEADPASVSGFRLDKYEVTVGRFRQFVNAVLSGDGGPAWSPPAASGKHTHLNGGNGLNSIGGGYESGWVTSDNEYLVPTNANLACPGVGTWTSTPAGQETLPMNCVNWYEAYAFCIWDGGFLPSAAEWEYAAAGGSQQREYPWGATDPGTNSQYAIYDGYYPDGAPPDAAAGTPGTCPDYLTCLGPVGTAMLGAGVWDQLDLAGSMSEWTLDWYATYVDPCTDCANLAGGSARVTHGGSFIAGTSALHPATIDADTPTYRMFYYGFRCARTP